MADEALTCFTSLLENVPAWIADLESILEAAKGTQQELLLANRPAVSSEGLWQTTSKSSSLKSKRSKDEDHTSRAACLRPTLKHLTNSDALRLSQRKRKTASVASGDQSLPCKFRNKGSAVLYYDGDAQKRFETLVRGIGSSRNSIRKGKMSAKVDALSRSGSSCSESSSNSSDDGGDYSRITSGLKHRSSRSRLPAFGRNDGCEAFDKVDGRLEKAQSLCERAAHQVLRDGDCALEIHHAKEHFSEALKMATAEIPLLQKKADKAAERRRRSAEQHRLDDEAQAAVHISEHGSVLGEESRNQVANVTVPSDGDIEVDILEVDDAESSSGEEEFNISSFKFTKSGGRFAPQMRTTRLAAAR